METFCFYVGYTAMFVAPACSCEVRAVIRFLMLKALNKSKFADRSVKGSCVDVKNVRKLGWKFTTDHMEIHGDKRSGKRSISKLIVAKVRQIA